MADDPYATLGVARDASADEIRRAYRKLAKQHHPDLNPGNKAAEDRFKAISAAHELLSDPEKRARFDRGEIDASGQERAPPGGYRTYADTSQGDRYGGGWQREEFQQEDWHPEDLEDLFAAFGGRGGARQSNAPRRGRDALYGLTVEFLDAVNGAAKRLTLPDGRTLDVKVPPGMQDGQTMRLRGQGGPGRNGGPAGDALIEIHVAPHKFFRREGQDIRLDLPVTVKEAVLGGPVLVPTPGGKLRATIPAGSDTGKELRLRGRGVPAHGGQAAGDLYVTLRVVVGPTDAAFEEFLRSWQPPAGSDPRREMEEGA
ncbi:MAG: J domain-containing protein [Proteobacteria bacterium]|nr:J domain-containing protein [Pseudomonadota bacterium]